MLSGDSSRVSKWVGFLTVCVGLGWGVVATARAELSLGAPFGDHMVLQRDRPIRIWGMANAHASVTIKLGSNSESVTANGAGRWNATLQALPAGGPFTLEVSSDDQRAALSDVLMGDVWLCSGQSNMQMSVSEAIGGEAAMARAGKLGQVRLAKVGNAWTDTPQSKADIKWQVAGAKSVGEFSAVGYFFAEELTRDRALKDVPIGVVQSSVGGTVVEAWTPREGLAGFEAKELYDSMFGIKPTTLYNGMIAPLGEMQLKGVVWYQGEGNAGHPENYSAKLVAMIQGWRKQFGTPELGFIVVGLPDFLGAWDGQYWCWLREAQAGAVEKTPGAWLALGINTTDGRDLHPKEKVEIGRRVALIARREVYGEQVVARGPMFRGATVEGGKVRVEFVSEDGLATGDGKGPRGFMVAGEDGEFRYAEGVIEGSSVVVSSELVRAPKFVRYGWAGVPGGSLTNKSGLPAYPFRTDDLPRGNIAVEPLVGGRRLNAQGYEVVVSPEGWITSLVVGGKQFLSNEPGVNGGVGIATFFGPRGLSTISELGPDALSVGDRELTMTVLAAKDALTLTMLNTGKEKVEMRVSLASTVRVEQAKDGGDRLIRKGAGMTVRGVDSVEVNEEGSRLKVFLLPNVMKTVVFSIDR